MVLHRECERPSGRPHRQRWCRRHRKDQPHGAVSRGRPDGQFGQLDVLSCGGRQHHEFHGHADHDELPPLSGDCVREGASLSRQGPRRCTQKKALSPVRGEGSSLSLSAGRGDCSHNQSSSSTFGSPRRDAKWDGQSTFFSPGKVRLKLVASYQFKWLSVSTSTESGLVSLPANICSFIFCQARAILLSGRRLAVTPAFRGIRFGRWAHGWKFATGGVPVTKAVRIGEATRSNWFIGGRPRI